MKTSKRTVKCKCGSFEYISVETDIGKPVWKCASCGLETHRQVRNRVSSAPIEDISSMDIKPEEPASTSKKKVVDPTKLHAEYLTMSDEAIKKAKIIYASVASPYCEYEVKISKEDALNIFKESETDEFSITEHKLYGSYMIHAVCNTITQ